MKYLIDLSTLRSAFQGLNGHVGEDRIDLGYYLRQPGDTEGLTQLLDIARLVDLVVLSDEIFISAHSADVCFSGDETFGSPFDLYFPSEFKDIAKFIPLNNDLTYFSDLSLYAEDIKNLENDVMSVEKLLNSIVTDDFVFEMDSVVTDRDRQFVEILSDKLAVLFTAPKKGTLVSILGDKLRSLSILPISRDRRFLLGDLLGVYAPIFFTAAQTEEEKSRIVLSLIARTFQYIQTADLNHVPYACHAYRSPILRVLNPRLTNSSFDLYGECESKLKAWLRDTYGSGRLEFTLPMFFLAVLKETHSSEDLFKVARQFRDSKEAIRIRQIMSEVTDDRNQINLLRFAELHRIADEETKHFQRKFASGLKEQSTSSFSAELSLSPTSIAPRASVDLLKLSKAAVKWLTEWSERRSVAVIFGVARQVYEVLSLESDLKRVWGVSLTRRHKVLLHQISKLCDP